MRKGIPLSVVVFLAIVYYSVVLPHPSGAEKRRFIKMSTTTSTENSGLLDILLPRFTLETGIRVKVFVKGAGAALRDCMEGNVDIVLVHAKKREEKFVSEGFGAYRLQVMHNDLVIIGPKDDTARIKGMKNAVAALRKIWKKKARFVSRRDDSGIHIKEQELWEATGLKLKTKMTRIVKNGKIKSLIFRYPGGLGCFEMKGAGWRKWRKRPY